MQVTETLSDGLKRAFSVVVPAADIEGKCRAKLADISRTIKLPGFRPGKVPVNLIRQRYGSAVLAEVMQTELDEVAGQVVEGRGLRPAGQPRIALTGEKPDIASGKAQDLSFTLELEVLPDIIAPDLASLQLVRLRTLATDEQIETALNGIAQRYNEMATVEDGGAVTGDRLTADFVGTIDGVPFEGNTGTDAELEIGGTGFIPGFVEQLEGMHAGEQRRIEVTFPELYPAEDLRGKTAAFDVTAKALKRPVAPVIDEAFAARLGFESLVQLREAVRQQIQRDFDEASRLRIKRELLDQLAVKAEFPAPENLVNIEFGAIWQRVEADLKQGRGDEEDRGKDEATLRAEYRAIADRRVRLGLLLSEIGRTAGVQVTQQELNMALRQEAMRFPGQEKMVIEFFRKTPQAVDQLRGPIFEDKVVDYILEMAHVDERIVSPEVLNAPMDDDGIGLQADETPALLRAIAAETAAREAENVAPEAANANLEAEAADPGQASDDQAAEAVAADVSHAAEAPAPEPDTIAEPVGEAAAEAEGHPS
jgi:trigger factor